jgi:hypothetical protein
MNSPITWVLVGLLTLTTACTGNSGGSDPSAKPSSSSTNTCDTVNRGSLPTWARGGFTPPTQKIAHVVGDSGDIAGVLFGDPLSSPRTGGGSNKILWVSRPQPSGSADLKIHATLAGTSTVADRTVAGGPGPSTLNLPKAGCWTLDLRWSGHSDTVRLEYAKG